MRFKFYLNIALIFSIFFLSCKTPLQLPTKEESQKKIAIYKTAIDANELALSMIASKYTISNDILISIKKDALNKVISKFAGSRSDDITIDFPSTRPLMKEEKSFLGIGYTNYIDIDTGKVVMNLSELQFESFKNNRINAVISISGKGTISVSGKYIAVPASVTPEIKLNIKEKVQFELVKSPKGVVSLIPIPQKINLNTVFYLTFIKWKIPWSEDIPLELSDIIQPIELPLNLKQDAELPLPESDKEKSASKPLKYSIELTNLKTKADSDIIELQTNIDFKRK